jgi:TolA-binding protein
VPRSTDHVEPAVAQSSDTPHTAGSLTRAPNERARFVAHVERGEYEKAYAILAQRQDIVGSSAQDLMRAADAARLSGHPGRAVPYLERIVRDHASDSRASLAAFTLGRIYLSQLGQPRQAARAFATARRLAPGGALAPDALAREAEAARAAGDSSRAMLLAAEYLERYPEGRRREAMQRLGGKATSR